MPVHALTEEKDAFRGSDAVRQARVDLAAALRLAVLHGLDEGIDNHFTVTVPGETDKFLILPFGLHWSEARASDMIVFDEAGDTLGGEGAVELSAQCIHAPVHRITGARVVLHTHQTWALALNMLANNRLITASQTSIFFHGSVAYDDDYQGLAHSVREGERLATLMGDKSTMFMKNHGVLVVADTVARAYHQLYMLERVCRAQVLAMSTGEVLQPIAEEIIAEVRTPSDHDRHDGTERDRLFFEAMKRVLDRENPGYAE